MTPIDDDRPKKTRSPDVEAIADERVGDGGLPPPNPNDAENRADVRPRCLKRRLLRCDEATFDALADRYHRHLSHHFGDRGDEVALAIREELMNYLEHSAGFDASRRLQVVSCRIGMRLVFFWGMVTDRTFDPEHRSSGKYRGHGLNIIGSFADLHHIDTDVETGTGSTTVFDLSRSD